MNRRPIGATLIGAMVVTTFATGCVNNELHSSGQYAPQINPPPETSDPLVGTPSANSMGSQPSSGGKNNPKSEGSTPSTTDNTKQGKPGTSGPKSSPGSKIPDAGVHPGPSPSKSNSGLTDWKQVFEEDFNNPLSTADWLIYNSPTQSPPRSRNAVSVSKGMLHLRGGRDSHLGDKDVGAGVMSRRQMLYGRWEIRFRVQMGAGYAAEVLLWPKNDGDWPAPGEIDIAEVNNLGRQLALHYLHHGRREDKVNQVVHADFTKFHTVAVDWTPKRVDYYVDGRRTFSVTPSSFGGGIPNESMMHLTLQLDQGCSTFIPCRNVMTPPTVYMDVDWVRIYEHK